MTDRERASTDFFFAQLVEAAKRQNAKLDEINASLQSHRETSAAQWEKLSTTVDKVGKLEAVVSNHEKWKNRLWWVAAVPGAVFAVGLEWVKTHLWGKS